MSSEALKLTRPKYPENVIQRFWAHVQKTNSCWLWTLSKNERGYGQLRVNSRRHYAHRFAYEVAVGPILSGLFVCHKCDVRSCVNPNHLFLGTAQDNTDDMVKKGRANNQLKALPGVRNGRAKLRPEVVKEIRGKISESCSDLARRHGVSRTTIRNIQNGKLWSHL